MVKVLLPGIGILFIVSSCSTINKSYNPDKKYPREQLQRDYTLLRNILEKKHPSLYWYTSKDSMDYYFDKGYSTIADSMTELQFGWQILAPLANKIHCGHTSFSMSKGWNKFVRHKRIPYFPLQLKIWKDTMVVTGNMNHKDSAIKRGTLLTSINGLRNQQVISRIFNYLPLDGYSENVNYVRLSSNFPYYHRNIFGIYKNYRVGYIDSTGKEKSAVVAMFTPPVPDSGKKAKIKIPDSISRRVIRMQVRESYRSMTIDTALNTSVMTLNTFSKGGGRHMRYFIRSSFRKIRKQKLKNLILDLRINGGGDISMYVLLTKYLRSTKFKVADTAYATVKTLKPYTKYIPHGIFNNIGLFFLTKRQKDGRAHFGYWERHEFKPKRGNHFDGKVYVLINGPTFSASTLFCNAVKGQENILLIGEEAGGGWHGNNGIMIPDIKLPITKLRFRLPVFRLVQYNHVPKDGRGVPPDIFIPPTVEGVRRGEDRKMEMVKQIIRNND